MSAIPLNLPHARTIVQRIEMRLSNFLCSGEYATEKLESFLGELAEILSPFDDTNDPGDDCQEVRNKAVEVARRLVYEIEALEIGSDRVGQAVRNLFECLGFADHGADLSLRAGENPNSLLRPMKAV